MFNDNESKKLVKSQTSVDHNVGNAPSVSKGTQIVPTIIKRVRMEIIFSQALEEDFKVLFKENGIGKKFTKFEAVMGAGYSNPRLGDAVWPQLNMMYVIYCDKEEAKLITSVVKELRRKYITEGIACFMSQAIEL